MKTEESNDHSNYSNKTHVDTIDDSMHHKLALYLVLITPLRDLTDKTSLIINGMMTKLIQTKTLIQ